MDFNVTWEDLSQAHLSSFAQSWPQYVFADNMRQMENSGLIEAMLANVSQVVVIISLL